MATRLCSVMATEQGAAERRRFENVSWTTVILRSGDHPRMWMSVSRAREYSPNKCKVSMTFRSVVIGPNRTERQRDVTDGGTIP